MKVLRAKTLDFSIEIMLLFFLQGGEGGVGGEPRVGTGDEGRERPSKKQFSNAFRQFSKAVIQIIRQFSKSSRSWDESQVSTALALLCLYPNPLFT